MEEIGIIICLRNKNKTLNNVKKNHHEAKKSQFSNDINLIMYAMIYSCTIKSISSIPFGLTFIKAKECMINKHYQVFFATKIMY